MYGMASVPPTQSSTTANGAYFEVVAFFPTFSVR
jgi:hypothetical protein